MWETEVAKKNQGREIFIDLKRKWGNRNIDVVLNSQCAMNGKKFGKSCFGWQSKIPLQSSQGSCYWAIQFHIIFQSISGYWVKVWIPWDNQSSWQKMQQNYLLWQDLQKQKTLTQKIDHRVRIKIPWNNTHSRSPNYRKTYNEFSFCNDFVEGSAGSNLTPIIPQMGLCCVSALKWRRSRNISIQINVRVHWCVHWCVHCCGPTLSQLWCSRALPKKMHGFYFCRMAEHNAAIQHCAVKVGQDVGCEEKIKGAVQNKNFKKSVLGRSFSIVPLSKCIFN